MSDILTGPWEQPPRNPTTYDLMRLADLVVDYVNALPEDADPLDPEHDRLDAWLEALEVGIPEKLESLYHVQEALDSWAERLRKQEKRLAKRRKQMERQREAVREKAVLLMETHKGLTGESKLHTDSLRCTLYATPGRVELDLGALPEGYGDTTWVPNKARVKAALQKGVEVPGAKLVKSNAVRWG